jgi:hypothetical protein
MSENQNSGSLDTELSRFFKIRNQSCNSCTPSALPDCLGNVVLRRRRTAAAGFQPLVAVYKQHSADQHQTQDNQHHYKCDAYWIYVEITPHIAGLLVVG